MAMNSFTPHGSHIRQVRLLSPLTDEKAEVQKAAKFSRVPHLVRVKLQSAISHLDETLPPLSSVCFQFLPIFSAFLHNKPLRRAV